MYITTPFLVGRGGGKTCIKKSIGGKVILFLTRKKKKKRGG